MQTISQKVIEKMTAEGYKLAGRTTGNLSYRAGSNLARKLESMGLTEATCEVRTGARAAKNASAGYELLIFTK